ncbi:MAG TPA: ABC transporter permease, partial [Chloroflexota bacterium]
MGAYLIRRLLFSVAALFAVITLVFFVARLSPQDPVMEYLRLNATAQGQINMADYARMRHELGLDRPLPVQYFAYVDQLLHGDLGTSITQRGRSVASILRAGIPISLEVAGLGLLIQFGLGTTFGVIAASRQNGRFDRVSMGLAIWMGAVPQLVVGALLVVIFGVRLHWLPIHGWGTPKHWIMPVITLAVTGTAAFARIGRATTLEQFNQEFVRTARAKGLSEKRVLFVHVLRNALIPIVTFLGPSVAFVITGNFVVETLFGIPGVAYYA